VTLLGTFPSPSSGTIELGPLTVHMYGLMLLLAIGVCIALTGYRWARLGGDWDLVFRAAVWGVAFGIVGARLYHVVTSWDEVPDEWWGVFAVWEGGLGVWGGILLGCVLAQGIGRWGNWWNQELFGKPTELPWALDVDFEHCPGAYQDLSGACTEDFHPTFLYEFVYDLAMVGVLLAVGSRLRIVRHCLLRLVAVPALRRERGGFPATDEIHGAGDGRAEGPYPAASLA
jgi:prolipoprotein diacylglyceryltransferase